jgi:hypothetical protein
MPTLAHSQLATREVHRQREVEPRRKQAFALTLVPDGITPDDYIQWIRDPDPPSRSDLTLTAVRITPPNQIRLELVSRGDPPPATDAAAAVGFPITPELVEMNTRVILPVHRLDAE